MFVQPKPATEPTVHHGQAPPQSPLVNFLRRLAVEARWPVTRAFAEALLRPQATYWSEVIEPCRS